MQPHCEKCNIGKKGKRNAMKTPIILILLMCIISCAEPAGTEVQSNDSSTGLESIKQDSLHDEASWYSKYGWQYEQVSYESIEDSFLKKALEIYFVMDDEKEFTEYRCKEEKETDISNIEHAKDYSIEFESQPFDSTKHKFTRCEGHFICLIDGKVYWGLDGGMPVSEISRFKVKYKDRVIHLPETDYSDLYSPFTEHCPPDKIHVTDGVNSYIVFITNCSDGAGFYTVAWIFKDGKYIRRVVDSSC